MPSTWRPARSSAGERTFGDERHPSALQRQSGRRRGLPGRPAQLHGAHDLHTTGLHQHRCDFQMFYVLKGWIKLVYEGHGEHTFQAGDCVLQPAGIVHNELECSDDVEILEILSPAAHQTVRVDTTAE